MTVARCLLIDGVAQFQALLNVVRTEGKERFDLLGDLAVRELHVALAVSVHKHAHRLSHTDGIGQLHEHFVGHTGGYHVFGDVARSVSGRTVHLRGVFSGESPTAVCALAAVSVDNDLASRQTGVAMRAADHEFAGRVHVVSDVALFKQCLDLGRVHALFEHSGDEHLNHVFADLRQHAIVGFGLAAGLFGGDKLVVLRAHHDGVDAQCATVVVILHRYLALGVGAQIGHHLSFATNVGQHN